MKTSYQRPLRNPPINDSTLMKRRGWTLLVAQIIPGSAQMLAGYKKLGRLAIFIDFLVLVVGIVLGGFALRDAAAVGAFFANDWNFWLWTAEIIIGVLGLFYIYLVIHTFAIIRVRRVPTGSRISISAVLVLVMAVIVAVSGVGISYANSARGMISNIFTTGGTIKEENGRYNFVLLGGDDGADRQGMRPDSINVISIDAKTGKTAIIGIPRDLYPVRLPADSPMKGKYPLNAKANAGYTYGSDPSLLKSAYKNIDDPTGFKQGMQAMMDIASGVTGLKVNYYVLIDMGGFAKFVDALGGVNVCVTKKLELVSGTDTNPIHSGWIYPGCQKMDGNTALWYARSRKTTSDWDRMERQRQLLEGLYKQFTPTTLMTKFDGIAKTSPDFVKTNIPNGSVGTLVSLADSSRKNNSQIQQLALTPPEFAAEYIDWSQVDQAVGKTIAAAS